MKKITWKIKDSWEETKRHYPGEYTTYHIGWFRFERLFPDVKHQFGYHLDLPGKSYSLCNFRKIEWGKAFAGEMRFYLRVDLYFGGWFFTVTRPDREEYGNVDVVSIT